MDIRRFQCVDVVFCQLNMSHVWMRGVFGVGVGAERACGKGSVDSQHVTEAEGSLHPCTKVPHQARTFFIFTLIATEVLIIFLVYVVNMLFVLFILFSSAGCRYEKHPCILGPISLVVNSIGHHDR